MCGLMRRTELIFLLSTVWPALPLAILVQYLFRRCLLSVLEASEAEISVSKADVRILIGKDGFQTFWFD